jgi:hypothetical protein
MSGEPEAAPASAEPEEAPPSAERELFFGMAAERLRGRARWAAVLLLLAFVVPYELVDDRPLFVWEIVRELPLAAAIAAFAVSLAGLAILIFTWSTRRAGSLAVAVLASLAGVALVIRLGADRAAWDVLPLPESVTNRPLAAMLGLSLTGAGLGLAFKPHTRRAGRIVLAVAAVMILLFYVWPARGEAPITTLARLALVFPSLPSFRFMLGYGLVALVACYPGLVALLAAGAALRPPAREPRMLILLAVFGFPGLLLMFVFRSLLLTFGDSSLPATLGSVAVLVGFLGVVASAVEVLTEVLVLRGRELTDAPGWPIRRALSVAAAALAVIGLGEWILARPPEKGVDWKLAPATPAADALYGTALGKYNVARLRWDDRVRERSSASEMVDFKAAARELVDTARTVDAGVGSSFEALVRESRQLDLAGRRWYRLVGDTNEASRRAGLPYYVDPAVFMHRSEDGLRRRFGVYSYRIERVRAVRVGSQRFATLHVRRIGLARDGHQRLGFSRDLQPFALVVLDEIEPFETELAEFAGNDPPSCGEALDAEAPEASRRCSEILRDVVRAPGGLGPALVAMTERHELEHQIDGPHLPLSEAVLDGLASYSESAQDTVNRELSAYVAELTSAEGQPQLGLVHLLRFAWAPPRSSLHHVSLLAFEALADRELRLPLLGMDRPRLAAAFVELSRLDAPTLRDRARTAWHRLYDTRLPEVHPEP